MPSGRVDQRTMKSTGKTRLRFYGVAEDQLATIMDALKVARQGCATTHDTVALEAICLNFLAGHSGSSMTHKAGDPDGDL